VAVQAVAIPYYHVAPAREIRIIDKVLKENRSILLKK
jgi:hypothetical protein